jgi:hypothetical protein
MDPTEPAPRTASSPRGPSRLRRNAIRGAIAAVAGAGLLWLAFPWRLQWGDVVLVDRGPLHRAQRFEFEFGEIVVRDGEQRRWVMPSVPGRGCLLSCRDWPAAFGRAEAASIEIHVEDGDAVRDFTIHWDTDFAVAEVAARWREVAWLPRRDRPVAVVVRVQRAKKTAVGPTLTLRGIEPLRE